LGQPVPRQIISKSLVGSGEIQHEETLSEQQAHNGGRQVPCPKAIRLNFTIWPTQPHANQTKKRRQMALIAGFS
jgi:hypothetical protein